MSKYVTSWFVELLPTGIYQVIFNLTERWLPYHAYNDDTYIFGEDSDKETQEEWEARTQKIPKFLPEDNHVTYIHAATQNKEQVIFYYIPFRHEWLHQQKILFSSYGEQ